MTPDEVATFVTSGQNYMSTFAIGVEQMARWAQSFEQRGGAETFGDDALQIVYLTNDLQEFLTPERRATIARLRSDV